METDNNRKLNSLLLSIGISLGLGFILGVIAIYEVAQFELEQNPSISLQKFYNGENNEH